MVTRQAFEQTARIIRNRVDANKAVTHSDDYGQGYSMGTTATLQDMAHDFARQYAIDNPRFDTARFMAVCGF